MYRIEQDKMTGRWWLCWDGKRVCGFANQSEAENKLAQIKQFPGYYATRK